MQIEAFNFFFLQKSNCKFIELALSLLWKLTEYGAQ